jgi:predicted nucleic acid-binding protein
VIVLDASAALSALLNDGDARSLVADQQVHVPHQIDHEIVGALHHRVRSGAMTPEAGWSLVDTWRRLAATRYPVQGLLARVWQLQDSLSTYDASYVALAESLGCTLVTVDARVSRAPGLRCPVTVIPR